MLYNEEPYFGFMLIDSEKRKSSPLSIFFPEPNIDFYNNSIGILSTSWDLHNSSECFDNKGKNTPIRADFCFKIPDESKRSQQIYYPFVINTNGSSCSGIFSLPREINNINLTGLTSKDVLNFLKKENDKDAGLIPDLVSVLKENNEELLGFITPLTYWHVENRLLELAEKTKKEDHAYPEALFRVFVTRYKAMLREEIKFINLHRDGDFLADVLYTTYERRSDADAVNLLKNLYDFFNALKTVSINAAIKLNAWPEEGTCRINKKTYNVNLGFISEDNIHADYEVYFLSRAKYTKSKAISYVLNLEEVSFVNLDVLFDKLDSRQLIGKLPFQQLTFLEKYLDLGLNAENDLRRFKPRGFSDKSLIDLTNWGVNLRESKKNSFFNDYNLIEHSKKLENILRGSIKEKEILPNGEINSAREVIKNLMKGYGVQCELAQTSNLFLLSLITTKNL